MKNAELNYHWIAYLITLITVIGFGPLLIILNYHYANGTYNNKWGDITEINIVIISFMLIAFIFSFIFYRYHLSFDFVTKRIQYTGYLCKKRMIDFDELESIEVFTGSKYVYIFNFKNAYKIKIDTLDFRATSRAYQLKFEEIITYFKTNYSIKIDIHE